MIEIDKRAIKNLNESEKRIRKQNVKLLQLGKRDKYQYNCLILTGIRQAREILGV